MTNPRGRFGIHGGQYIPETLMNAVIELEAAYDHFKNDPEFNRELSELFYEYAGRPSRLYFAKKMTEDLGGAKIYLKREDLNHTGAHKINNVLGQALLAKKMGKTRLIAETGAGQHGVATATAAALFGMECVVFMGEEDTIRQALNVYRMRLLGAENIRTCGTVVYTPMQAFLAAKAGASFVAPYVNRIDNMGYDGVKVVKEIQDILVNNHLDCMVLAASFKNSQQVMELCAYGVSSATAAPAVIDSFVKNPAIDAAVQDFLTDFEKATGKTAMTEF